MLFDLWTPWWPAMCRTIRRCGSPAVSPVPIIGARCRRIFTTVPVKLLPKKKPLHWDVPWLQPLMPAFYRDFNEAADHMVKVTRHYEPNPDTTKRYEDAYQAWHQVYHGLSGQAFDAVKDYQEKYRG